MRVVVISMGSVAYAKPAEEVLTDYFRRCDVPYAFLTGTNLNYSNAHPSWLKLILHRIFDDDFIVAWDLDLLPRTPTVNIFPEFDTTRLNMCVDSSLLAGFPGFTSTFRYNGGLIGMPRSLSPWLASIYDNCAPGTMPSYEQYYLNKFIHDDNISVNVLPNSYNTLMPRNPAGKILWDAAINRHYTFGVMEEHAKTIMIQEHLREYFGQCKA